ncbi:hypothetical protein BX600DRAFT_400895 [Xylariales sp. PMI_506]|nr:hypothetical protein BX600DRAFT_400895 [Xylariales sp. PMI_506]
MMVKGALPPTIATAMYQAPVVNRYFTSLGYLIPMVTLLAVAILPRGKYIQNLLLNSFAILLSAAISLLAMWSATRARAHTSAGAAPGAYNASASAVGGIWLFFLIWFGNTLRAKMPAFNVPIIIFSVIINITTTTAPNLVLTAQAEALVKELLACMFVGLAIATAVNMMVFPVSGRLVVFKQFEGIFMLARKTVQLQKRYLNQLESDDMFERPNPGEALSKEGAAAATLTEITAKVRELGGKLHGDLHFAKREIAWGKLRAGDLSDLLLLMRNVYVPLLGISTISDIFQRVAHRRGWDTDAGASAATIEEKNLEKQVWNEVMTQLHEPLEILSQAVDQGLLHAGLSLEIIPNPAGAKKTIEDVESKAGQIVPGEAGFANIVAEKVQRFSSTKDELLKAWTRERGLITNEEIQENPNYQDATGRRQRDQAQLYVILYMENLMRATGEAVVKLVEYADKKLEDGTMTKNKLIVPDLNQLKKWVSAVFAREESSGEQSQDVMHPAANIIYHGDSFAAKKDPEHLPPTTSWQRFGNSFRNVYAIVGSQESMFGLRVSLANMTVGILAFLEVTQDFFQKQRLVWAMIIIAIGMSVTAGQSAFSFVLRLTGTVIAMILALIDWYIVDGKIPGVIVFEFLSLVVTYYFFIKYPLLMNATILVLVTLVLIIGYELQVVTVGIAVAASNGQPYYPTSELAPFRLATQAAGAFIGFLWTIFPSPITDRTLLRRDLSATMYLLANYFSVINSALASILDGTHGDLRDPGSPAHRLLRVRDDIFSQIQALLPSMTQHAAWERWEPTFGGRFPREEYQEIIRRSNRAVGYLTLMSYTLTRRPEEGADNPEKRAWIDRLNRAIADGVQPTHHTIVLTLTLLSNAIQSGQSLPPILPLPRPWNIGGAAQAHLRLDGEGEQKAGLLHYSGPAMLGLGHDADDAAVTSILDARNADQPGYAEFATMQVCSTLVCDDLDGLVRAVGRLVGVVDFSFRVDSAKGGYKEE